MLGRDLPAVQAGFRIWFIRTAQFVIEAGDLGHINVVLINLSYTHWNLSILQCSSVFGGFFPDETALECAPDLQ